MNNDIEKVLYTQDQLNKRMDELAQELTAEYKRDFPLIISVMTGAMIFTGDMLKRLNFKLNVDVMKASSYVGAHSTGDVKIIHDVLTDVKGRRVILFEDIIDTGHTLKAVKELLLKRGAKTVEICAMLDKPESREVALKGDYIGYSAPDEYLVGYGLDYSGMYRNLPYVGVLKKEVYTN
ncbi:hypoxanthine phosphoribosyltransferase [Lactobacillus sp. PV037]|uniref:hypoxanthine phosphoribosyltransferase n=1 Tax=unclassified Lactobacillus TaxID=2620435 RepID=UPI0022408096|nr:MULTISPECIES: hypoxanthine phosphoribosyltransferase [unclassified Lactobacillus]QNQ82162.1 hypoxanthine phosphoribosyltransferase [Lactobacillus sp. PV012]QNQ83728.1 hypoxanthine phosphoribosyltransferase [Lactobacillus sp. PV037]